MMLHDRDIVCLSTHYWDERWFRKQEFMSRFTQANRVLFVEPSFSMVRRPEVHLREVAANRLLRPRLEARGDRLHLLKPPRGLPKWTDPRVEQLTYRWYGRVIARAISQLGFRDAILWVYQPSFLHSLTAIPHRQLVFDLVDDLAAYGGDGGSPQVESSVQALVRSCDLLVATAQTLLDRYEQAARRSVHIANGFDPARFAPAGPGAPPAALTGIRPPILGFIGTVFSFLDFELLERVARCHDDKSIVLIGPVESNARGALTNLSRLPNVHHLGARPQAEIPSYIACFDVCLNIFRVNRVADSAIPLKVFEYLAAGKPVVSTSMRALEQEAVADQITFAAGPEQFCEAIDRCLLTTGDSAQRAREDAVAPYAWDRLFERLDAECAAALPR